MLAGDAYSVDARDFDPFGDHASPSVSVCYFDLFLPSRFTTRIVHRFVTVALIYPFFVFLFLENIVDR